MVSFNLGGSSIEKTVESTSAVVGSTSDSHTANTVYSKVDTTVEHIHGVSRVFPTLATGILVTAAGGAWIEGTYANILSASAVGSQFDLHYVNIETLSANAAYELVFATGSAGNELEVARVRFNRLNNNESANGVPIMTPLLPANVRVAAKLASSTGGATVNVSVYYHTYS